MGNLDSLSASKGTMKLMRWGLRVALIAAAMMTLATTTRAQQGSPPPVTYTCYNGAIVADPGLCPAPPGQMYTITDLGVVSTVNGNASGDTDSKATAINNSGTVVGYSGNFSGGSLSLTTLDAHDAFIWTPDSNNGTTGTIAYLGGLSGDYCYSPEHTVGGITTPAGYGTFPTIPSDINNAGQVVGQSYMSPDLTCASLVIHAALWKNGTVVDLGVPPPPPGFPLGYGYSYATSINDAGQIVGFAQLVNSSGYSADAWIYDGSYHILGSLPNLGFAVPNKINNNGTLVGTSSSLAQSLGFKHTGTGPLQLTENIGTLGGSSSVANGVNLAGMVVGSSSIEGDSASHAFYIDQSQLTHDLGTLSFDPLASSGANAISNKAKDIVGWSYVDQGAIWISPEHAVLWTQAGIHGAGGPIDLNSRLDPLVVPPRGSTTGANPCPHIQCWELITATGINDVGQIVGEGIVAGLGQSEGVHHAFLLTPMCAAQGGDSDGDGLCDNWEKYGYTAPDGTFVDLPSMGADPMHKDIFIQADYMVNGGSCEGMVCNILGHSHQPKPDAVNLITAAFANAPVDNPDGNTGITLHIDSGPNTVMNPLTGATWGGLSQAHSMPEIPMLGQPYNCPPQGPPGAKPIECPYDFTDFIDIWKANLAPSRIPIFHYVLFAHQIDATDNFGNLLNPSGVSDNVPSSASIVSLGGLPGDPSMVGTDMQQAGTLMHELGHQLGLLHGGQDNVNWKPNYLSVMNYSFQDGLIYDGLPSLLDYSEFPSIPPLNEAGLDENVGLNGGVPIANYGTIYYCGGQLNQADIANNPIDWACDGSTTKTGVEADIAKTGNLFSILTDYEDWHHLIYDGGGIGFGVGTFTLTQPATLVEPESYVPPDPLAAYRVAVFSPGLAQVSPGASFNETFTLSNTGLQSDTYSLSVVSPVTWWNYTAIPSQVTLAGGSSQQFTVPVNITGCIDPGAQAELTLKAQSVSHPTIADSAIAQLIVTSNPAGTIGVPTVVGELQAVAEEEIVSAGLAVGTVTTQSSTTVPAGDVISQSPSGCGLVASGTTISIVVSSGQPLIAVPNVVGETQAAATSTISGVGLTAGSITAVPSSTIPAGNVISQSPAAGTEVTPGTPISLTVASIQLDVVPNVVGSPIASAISIITEAGFSLGGTSGAYSATVPAGTVLSQFPSAGGLGLPGSSIGVVVSSGSSSYGVVPNVLGDTQSAATSAILTAGFTLGGVFLESSTTVPKGDVIGQNPMAGVTTLTGTAVGLSISDGPQPYVVPNLYGLPQAAATTALTAAGLTLGTVTPMYDGMLVPAGDVFEENPVAGTYVSAGTPVNIYVATAPATDVVPDVSTTAYVNAALYITQAGLTPGTFTAEPSSTVSQAYVISESPAAGTSVPAASTVDVVYSAGSRLFTVPNVVGESQTSASSDITNAYFYVAVTRQPSTTVPDGAVISQSPAAGSQVNLYTIVTIVVSSGDSVTATVPNVVGMYGSQAEQTLFAAGFAVGSISTQPSTTVPAVHVISQTPVAGSSAPWDTSISLVFSSGPPAKVTVPNLVGLTQTAAVAAINSTSFAWTMTTQSSQTVPTGVVISQNPPAGVTSLAVDGSVNFVVSAGSSSVPTYTYLSQFGDYGIYNAVNGQFEAAVSIAIDPSNRDILVGDESGRVQIFDSNGNFKSSFGGYGVFWNSITGTGGLPYYFFFGGNAQNGLFAGKVVGAIAVDPINHNIVTVDIGADRVLIFNSAGVFLSSFGSPGYGPGQFFFDSTSTVYAGVAIDPVSENILVSDYGNSRVQVFNSAGVYLSQFGTLGGGDGQFSGPVGIAIDPTTRNIVVTDLAQDRVEIFNSAGGYLTQFGTPGSGNGSFYQPFRVAIDPATHNIVVSAQGLAISGGLQPYLQVFSSDGVYLSQFGGQVFEDQDGSTPTVFSSVGAALGLAIDPVSHNLLSLGGANHVEIYGTSSASAAAATALISSANPATAGQPVTFTATVTGNSPTGTVQFLDGDTSLGTPVALAGGTASLTTSTLEVGTDSITAVYSGDANNAASTSPLLNELIAASPTTTAVVASKNPIVAGRSVTFTATVTGSSPSGAVEFLNGSTSLGSPVSLTAGVATLTTSTLPVGTDSITAVYGGDSLNAASTSPVLAETVSLSGSTTSVLTSSAQAIAGQPITFTAIVSGDNPTGTVQFMDGTAILGSSVTLTGGIATLTTSSLPIGTHSITAVYSGDSSNATSTSAVLNEVVSLATTTTAVSSSLNPATVGQSVTFTATVSGVSPTGTVQFMDGAATLGAPVSLTGSAAALTLSTLSVGTHSITAVYSGDSSNFKSTSLAVSQVVLAATTTSVVSSLNPSTVGQSVTFTATATGSSPTGTIQFLDGSATLGTVSMTGGVASVTLSTLSVGTHSITAAYSGDRANTVSTSAVLSEVVSPATTPPVVTPPANISVPATQAGGATGSASPALAAYLMGGSAVDSSGPAPTRLPPQVGGVSVGNATLFPVGTTTVTFLFEDSSGNIGSATSTVTVSIGTPRITGSIAGVGTDPSSGAIYVNVVLTNTGTGNARNLQIGSLVFRTLSGTGTVTYNSTLSPPVPITIGNLDVGAAVTTQVFLNVPPTAKRISVTESGPVQDVLGTNYTYSTAEALVP